MTVQELIKQLESLPSSALKARVVIKAWDQYDDDVTGEAVEIRHSIGKVEIVSEMSS